MKAVAKRDRPFFEEVNDPLNTARLIHRVRQDLKGEASAFQPLNAEERQFLRYKSVEDARHAAHKRLFEQEILDIAHMSAMSLVAAYVKNPSAHAKIAFLNAHNVNVMLQDAHYRDVLKQQIILPDGVGLDLAAKVLTGSAFTNNLNGTDFVPALLTFMARPLRIGLLGAAPGTLAGAVANFRKHTPWHDFLPIADGFFEEDEKPIILKRLAEARLDILLVGMGTPLQEKWVAENIQSHHARVVLSVGALFDFMSGAVPRAPDLVRKLRLEWAFRLMQEPSRLWKRYILGIPRFGLHVLVEKRSTRKKYSF